MRATVFERPCEEPFDGSEGAGFEHLEYGSTILHRVTDPLGLLGALADVLAPGGEIVVETYGSRLAADTPAIEVRQPGDVYERDDFVYWGFPAEGLRRLGRVVGLDDVDIVDEVEVEGHPRVVAMMRSAALTFASNPVQPAACGAGYWRASWPAI
ncbi:MAG: class I SAM-dependent methyltransferase [Actinomycetota bacterium]|nr:class I SAM-dependent methyltransferase [Actinomycetota bacterium]